MDAEQRPVVIPQIEIAMDRRAWRKILGKSAPLAARTQNVHQPIDDLAQVNCTLVAAAAGGRDQRGDQRPFLIRQITGIAKLAAVVPLAVLRRPHRSSMKPIASNRNLLRKKRFFPDRLLAGDAADALDTIRTTVGGEADAELCGHL